MKIDRHALKETMSDVGVGFLLAFPISLTVLNICNYFNASILATSIAQTFVFTIFAIVRKYCIRMTFKKADEKNQTNQELLDAYDKVLSKHLKDENQNQS